LTVTIVSALFASGPALADTLSSTEFQITDTTNVHESRPTLGADIVVYTSVDINSGSTAKIFGRWIGSNGVPGATVEVSDPSDPFMDNRLNDVGGWNVLYTARDTLGLGGTSLVVYDLGSGQRDNVLVPSGSIFEARIHGDRIAFVRGDSSSSQVETFLKDDPSTLQTISGPTASQVAIGSEFIVWTEAGTEIWAHRISDGVTGQIEPSGGSNAATAGDWVVYEYDIGSETEIVGRQLSLTGHAVAVGAAISVSGSSGATSPRNPDIDADLIAYEGVPAAGGNFDIYLHRISDGAAFQVTSDGADQELNSIYGDKVAYGDFRSGGNADIWLSTLAFGCDDADGDGVCDVDDNCFDIPNDQTDSDGDGTGNACDYCPFDADNDADGDGVCGDVDNCPDVPNSAQGNVDGDGAGDACDFCPSDPNDDADGDGVCGDVDNCPGTANASQTDSDVDGAGDACDACALDPLNDIDGDGMCGDVDPCPLDPLNECGTGPVDVDGDGVEDSIDNCPNIANPDQSDLDFDLLGDACDDDIDGDGLNNDVDNCALTSDPDQTDTDSDGAGDVCDDDDDNDGVLDAVDNCQLVENPLQENLDGDAFGDACDTDRDGDGIDDEIDNCPVAPNPFQDDTDLDGVGDECDEDDDNDGICDTSVAGLACAAGPDNCATIVNPDQEDLDSDNIGDACDADLDGDGIDNDIDNCLLTANADQNDTDSDGAGDVCDNDDDGDGVLDPVDNCQFVINPGQSDIDGDGSGDACDADSDGDGIDNEIDNCPHHPNSDQNDLDGDAIGDSCDPDIDGDGVDNVADACAGTPFGEITDPANGCSIAQLAPCEGPRGTTLPWKNHGKYVSAMAHAANDFLEQGLITDAEKEAIMSAAAESACGKKK
jgi:beta propeller repeat protein